MDQQWQAKAISNSVDWYKSVIDSHGLVSERRESAWLCKQKVPPYYSNLISMMPVGSLTETIAELDSVLTGPWSIKDSYQSHNLGNLGFEILFNAKWFVRESNSNWPATISDRRWAVTEVEAAQDLEHWIDAWGETPAGQRVFLPEILQDESITFYQVKQESRIVAGLVSNTSDGVVGISNAFGAARGILSCIRAVREKYQPSAIVGYGRANQIRFLQRFGFRPVGGLQIWIKS